MLRRKYFYRQIGLWSYIRVFTVILFLLDKFESFTKYDLVRNDEISILKSFQRNFQLRQNREENKYDQNWSNVFH
jgi:hypothetical protein